ncbi:CRTAC1 family protein [Flexithrix dorotheae]|uniref:CRTAC1 family protein n=1 Tax=Flexithrix dorotheae TaxID=70993 RepID=UPI0003A1E91E|nr:CRTAC1 family protein [Flexithrix dorotheae]
MHQNFLRATSFPQLQLLLFSIFVFSACMTTNEESDQSNHKEMTEILKEVNLNFENGQNLFANSSRIKYLDSLLAVSAEEQKFPLLYEKAINLLRAGHSHEAAQIFNQLQQEKKERLLKSGLFMDKIRKIPFYLGLSYLRIGEQENCILNHTSASCIIPISHEGFHTKQEGSEMAIETFTQILKNEPNDFATRWLLNIAYMTLGKYPEQVPSDWLIPLSAFASDYPLPPFTDIAQNIGFDFRGLAGGLIVDDFDNDELLDIMVSEWGPDDQLHYLNNNGDGTFSDLTLQAGIQEITGGLNMIQADYNNDGFLDIFILRGAWLNEFGKQPNSLLKNNGDNTFSDVTISSGLLSYHPTQSATWNDFNNDGWLDLFIGNESNGTNEGFHFSELFLNNQDGTFSDKASSAGLLVNKAGFRLSSYYIKGVTSGDYNNDGWQDIYVSTGVFKKAQNFLFRNNGVNENGELTFTDVTREAGLGGQNSTFSTWFWDYNNDGHPDIFASSYFRGEFRGSIIKDIALEYSGIAHQAEKGFLYKNNGDGTFQNVSEATNLNRIIYAMGANFGDLDNDGFLDMYLGTGNIELNTIMPNKMFRNKDGEAFQDVTTAGGFGNIQKGHGVAFADLDHDGDQDVLISMGGAFEGDVYQNTFYQNPIAGTPEENNWVMISLVGETSNRFGIGCRIEIEIEDSTGIRKIYRDVNSGGSFGSNPLRQHIGLGLARKIKQLSVFWTGNENPQIFQNLEVNKYYRLRENNSRQEEIHLKILDFESKKSAHYH